MTQMKRYAMWALGAALVITVVVILAKPSSAKTTSVVVAPPLAMSRYPLPPQTIVESRTSRPISTPTHLGSKSGLGGGPLVGSQSTKIGGSSFLPSRRLVIVNNNNPQARAPYQWSRPSAVTQAPTAPTPSTFTPVVVDPVVDPVMDPVVAPPAAEVVPAVVPAPVMDEVVPTVAETPSTLVGGAYQTKRSAYFGATPTPYQTVNDVMIDSREGYIVQPR